MKFTRKVEVTTEVTHIHVNAAVRYDDEDMAYDFPFRDGDRWKAKVDIATGIIEEWPQGHFGNFYMKVCDEGIYTLLDAEGNEVTKKEGYVPNDLLPGEYGDYLSMEIDETGKITNWPKNPSLSDFTEEDS